MNNGRNSVLFSSSCRNNNLLVLINPKNWPFLIESKLNPIMITITGLRFDGYIIVRVRFWKFGNLFQNYKSWIITSLFLKYLRKNKTEKNRTKNTQKLLKLQIRQTICKNLGSQFWNLFLDLTYCLDLIFYYLQHFCTAHINNQKPSSHDSWWPMSLI